MAGGVFIDLDHLFDYVVAFGFHWDIDNFLNGSHFKLNGKVYVPFHAYEYVLLLFFTFSSSVFVKMLSAFSLLVAQ